MKILKIVEVGISQTKNTYTRMYRVTKQTSFGVKEFYENVTIKKYIPPTKKQVDKFLKGKLTQKYFLKPII